jgi:hypothetical protein
VLGRVVTLCLEGKDLIVGDIKSLGTGNFIVTVIIIIKLISSFIITGKLTFVFLIIIVVIITVNLVINSNYSVKTVINFKLDLIN